MIRRARWIGILALTLAGCASRTTAPLSAAAIDVQFTTEEQKMLACLDLQDHIVDLYTEEYETREGVQMSAVERSAFRDGWAEELAKRGTFDGFEQSCVAGVTPQVFACGMRSRTTSGIVECMHPTRG
jgi:hypothetical protein